MTLLEKPLKIALQPDHFDLVKDGKLPFVPGLKEHEEHEELVKKLAEGTPSSVLLVSTSKPKAEPLELAIFYRDEVSHLHRTYLRAKTLGEPFSTGKPMIRLYYDLEAAREADKVKTAPNKKPIHEPVAKAAKVTTETTEA